MSNTTFNTTDGEIEYYKFIYYVNYDTSWRDYATGKKIFINCSTNGIRLFSDTPTEISIYRTDYNGTDILYMPVQSSSIRESGDTIISQSYEKYMPTSSEPSTSEFFVPIIPLSYGNHYIPKSLESRKCIKSNKIDNEYFYLKLLPFISRRIKIQNNCVIHSYVELFIHDDKGEECVITRCDAYNRESDSHDIIVDNTFDFYNAIF